MAGYGDHMLEGDPVDTGSPKADEALLGVPVSTAVSPEPSRSPSFLDRFDAMSGTAVVVLVGAIPVLIYAGRYVADACALLILVAVVWGAERADAP